MGLVVLEVSFNLLCFFSEADLFLFVFALFFVVLFRVIAVECNRDSSMPLILACGPQLYTTSHTGFCAILTVLLWQSFCSLHCS